MIWLWICAALLVVLAVVGAFVLGALYGRQEAQVALDFANARLAAMRARFGA